jgi:tetratricopeptide (TPR) repeat protein
MSNSRKIACIAGMAGVVLLAGAGAAGPPIATRDPAQERAYANQLNDRTLIQAFVEATRLLDQGREAEAEAAYRVVAQAAPNHAPTQWRLSALARYRGDRAEAVSRARAALQAGDGWQARSTLAEALLMDIGNHRQDIAEVSRLVLQLANEHPGIDTAMLSALLAVTLNDTPALSAAVDELRTTDPHDMRTHYFSFLLYAGQGRLAEADQALSRAVELGLPAATAATLRQQKGIGTHSRTSRWARLGGGVLIGALLGLLAVYGLRRALIARTALRPGR